MQIGMPRKWRQFRLISGMDETNGQNVVRGSVENPRQNSVFKAPLAD